MVCSLPVFLAYGSSSDQRPVGKWLSEGINHILLSCVTSEHSVLESPHFPISLPLDRSDKDTYLGLSAVLKVLFTSRPRVNVH